MNFKVYLVGAGPGNAGFMTVRGAEVLGSADVVVHDSLVSAEVLRIAPKNARIIVTGDPSKDRAGELQSAIQQLTASENADKSVVLLRGGDPYISGQFIGEAAALRARGVAYEIIPGLSAHISDPGYAGVPNWAEKPLAGKRIIVTRTRDQAGKLTSQLQDRGANVLEVPTIKIVPPSKAQDITDAMLELNAYDWMVFTSANGVTAFFDLFFKGFDDMRDIGGVRIAAVGPATAARLKELHLKVDLMPTEYVASKIADALAGFESLDNLRILLLRAEVATPDLPKKLEELGAIVDDIACYKVVPETDDTNGAAALLTERGADWVTFTSGSTVENFHTRFDLPKLISLHPELKIASIGPETSKAIRALNLKPTFEAKEHTVEGLVQALEKAAKNKA